MAEEEFRWFVARRENRPKRLQRLLSCGIVQHLERQQVVRYQVQIPKDVQMSDRWWPPIKRQWIVVFEHQRASRKRRLREKPPRGLATFFLTE